MAELSSSEIDTYKLDDIWNYDLISNNPPKGKLKSISSILDSMSLEQRGISGTKISKFEEKKAENTKEEGKSQKPKITVEKSTDIEKIPELEDIIVKKESSQGKIEIEKKEINGRSYFPINIQKLNDLPSPIPLEKSDIVSLLSKDKNLDSYTNIILSPKYDFLENIVCINNSTLEMSGMNLFQGFVSDIDSICRLSVKWFESYPKFVKVLRTTEDKISGKYRPNIEEMNFNSSQKVRLSRRFTNDWINFLNLLKTIEIDSKTYRHNRRMLRKYKEINHKDLKQYHRNIYNELQLFNNLLLSILLKLSFYIQYIVYFPNTGKLFDQKEDYSYLSQFKEKYRKRLSNEDEILKLNKIDIYVNAIPKDILKKVRTTISSCSGVVKILHEYGVHSDSTPSNIISLYLQYKRITRILLNIYNNETNRQSEKFNTNGNNYEYSDNIFDQKFIPNKIGFKPFQTQVEGPKIQGKIKQEKLKHKEDYSGVTKNHIELKFNYLSKESVDKFSNENERNLFYLISQDLTNNKLNKGMNFHIVKKRPSGASGLVIFSQKYNLESEYDCGARILPNGKIEIDFNKNLLAGFSDKITIWFKNNYLKYFYNKYQENHSNFKQTSIPLQFKLMIACPYVTSNNYMQSQYGGMNDVYMLIYLVGKLKGYNDDWKIVTEFNSITNDTNLQWKIVSILIPDIQSHVGKMCPVQASLLKSKVLKTSRHVVFKSPMEFDHFSEEFKYENSNIKRSIIRNCLNYIEEETMIEFLTNNGKDSGMAICRNSNLYVG
ncbi:uncharacterized protein cubi_01669 [Cryptosporidium ubiquitum]|uniref:Uncharacterized protein n=1 Tax=Cryptosporidium ubiquitum TaxID=857276 RepID=A0A1J4MFE0_9CRYT|nr:uncharacterized protein cubi_01669 [Cryptosporidium ubiquitum]OII72719.1 hypothetical protein cubi_01669 [Cryptosporidium ubiquitum]